MRHSENVRLTIMVVALLVLPTGRSIARGQDSGVVRQSVALCELMGNPEPYAGKVVTVTARLTSTKDGTSMWDPGCKTMGLELEIVPSSRSNPDIGRLQLALKQHGLSDHPVMATLTGTFLYNKYDAVRRRARSLFSAISAADVQQSSVIERR